MKRLAWLPLLALLGAAAPSTPPADRRPPDQTFLTISEWFLVFSPEEYADYLRDHAPSRFPFFGHLRQFWQGYAAAAGASESFPANAGYHLMIVVIGTSTTVEYGLKGLYERLVGRFTEQVAGEADTAEDRIAARTAADYVAFIKVHPWYEFDFVTPLRAVWSAGFWGPQPLRKWERKYLLTTEYLAKAGYGWALGKATRSTYERPIEQTVVIATAPGGAIRQLALPRYQAFTDASAGLAREGADFIEIAGNRGPVVVTVLAGPAWQRPALASELFRQPILTRPGRYRYAVYSRVADLAATIRALDASGTRIEHIYDY